MSVNGARNVILSLITAILTSAVSAAPPERVYLACDGSTRF